MSDATEHIEGTTAQTAKGQSFHSWKEDTSEWLESENRLRYKVLPFGAQEIGTRCLVVRYEPGAEVAAHYHPTDYCSIVVEGSIEITRRVHEVGSIRIVKAGTAYGPLKVGPEGCTMVDVFAARSSDDPPITYVGRA